MIRPIPLFAALALSLAAAGCAAEEEDPTTASEAEVTSAKEPAIEVEATWRSAVTGTPTYGYDATEPFAAVKVLVDDEAVRRAHPGEGGYEKPFALLPRKDAAGNVRWERHDVPYRGETRRGYYGQIRVDTYELAGVKLSKDDLAAALDLGFAVGLETNVGTVWAQDAGKNFVPARVGP